MNAFAYAKIREAISDKPKTISQLIYETSISERTLRYNLAVLKERGVVKEFRILSDTRKKIFILVG